MSRECSVYLVDTNIIISAIIKGEIVRKCLTTCTTHYLIPKPVIEELSELLTTKALQDIASRIEKALKKGKITIEELLAREIELIAILLRQPNIEYIDVKPSEDDLRKAEEIIGYRDPDDIPIVAIALSLAKTYKGENVCIWTDDRDILDELQRKNVEVKAFSKPHCCK